MYLLILFTTSAEELKFFETCLVTLNNPLTPFLPFNYVERYRANIFRPPALQKWAL